MADTWADFITENKLKLITVKNGFDFYIKNPIKSEDMQNLLDEVKAICGEKERIHEQVVSERYAGSFWGR